MIVTALVWAACTFTSPSDSLPGTGQVTVTAYRATLARIGKPEETIRLFPQRDTLSGFPVPKPPGTKETLYFQLPATGQGHILKVYSVDLAGNISGPSNPLLKTALPPEIGWGKRWGLKAATIGGLLGVFGLLWAVSK